MIDEKFQTVIRRQRLPFALDNCRGLLQTMFKKILKFLNLPIKSGSDHFGNKYYEKTFKDGKDGE